MKIDFSSHEFVVTLPSGPELRIPIPEGDFIPEGFEFGVAWSRVLELMPPLEQAIDAIPVPDIFFGCLLRAGISTLTGQAIRCINEARRDPDDVAAACRSSVQMPWPQRALDGINGRMADDQVLGVGRSSCRLSRSAACHLSSGPLTNRERPLFLDRRDTINISAMLS